MHAGVIVKYDGAPYNCGCDYLVEVGYWGKVINLRTYAKQPRPLAMNGHTVSLDVANMLIDEIAEQFPKEKFKYEVKENK